MRIYPAEWLRTFQNQDEGGSATAVADAPADTSVATIDAPAQSPQFMGNVGPAAVSPHSPDDDDLGGDEPALATKPAQPETVEDELNEQPADAEAGVPDSLSARAKAYGLSDAQIQAHGDNLQAVLNDFDAMIVARVQAANQVQAPQNQTPNAQQQAQSTPPAAPQAPAGPYDLASKSKAVVAKLQESFDQATSTAINDAIAEHMKDVAVELQELRAFRQSLADQEVQQAQMAVEQEFAAHVAELDAELFGKDTYVKQATKEYDARVKMWNHINALALGQRQLGLPSLPMKELVQSAYATVFRDRHTTGWHKQLAAKAREINRGSGAKPTNRVSGQSHAQPRGQMASPNNQLSQDGDEFLA